jgi:hypothetical protein
VDIGTDTTPLEERVTPEGPPYREDGKLSRPLYLRAAQAYMLISMPTGTSTIFGLFQAIWLSLLKGRTPPSDVN